MGVGRGGVFAVKTSCLLDLTWLLHTRTHSTLAAPIISVISVKALYKPGPSTLSHSWGG